MTTGDIGKTESALDQVARRAQKRWRWAMASVVVGVAVLVPVLTPLLNHGKQHRHHSATAAALIAAIASLVGLLVVLALFGRKIWRNQGMFAAPLVGGLRRADRRTAGRAIRRGRPSSDPTLAAVERASAQHTLAHGRAGLVVFVVGGGGSLAEGLIHHGVGARVFYLAGAVMFGCFAVGQVWMLRVARRYLAATGTTAGE